MTRISHRPRAKVLGLHRETAEAENRRQMDWGPWLLGLISLLVGILATRGWDAVVGKRVKEHERGLAARRAIMGTVDAARSYSVAAPGDRFQTGLMLEQRVIETSSRLRDTGYPELEDATNAIWRAAQLLQGAWATVAEANELGLIPLDIEHPEVQSYRRSIREAQENLVETTIRAFERMGKAKLPWD